MIGTSAALSISDIPWSGPIGCLNVGYVDGNIVFNPTSEQRKVSKMDVTVAATGQKVGMIEAGADEIPEDIMYEGIVKAHEEIKKQVALINQMVASSARRSSLTSMRISTRSCSRISLPSDWKRPVSAWTRTTRTSARSAGTRLSAS
jgi:polyribonucleotide nucleotidyltransferase